MAEVEKGRSPYGFYTSHTIYEGSDMLSQMIATDVRLLRDESRNRHSSVLDALKPLNGHTALLFLNSIGIGALLVKVFA